MAVTSDDVVAVGLRLLWDLDAFLGDNCASRLDTLPPCEVERLHAAFAAASAALLAARPRKRNLVQRDGLARS
jgi:hypothetical protein